MFGKNSFTATTLKFFTVMLLNLQCNRCSMFRTMYVIYINVRHSTYIPPGGAIDRPYFTTCILYTTPNHVYICFNTAQTQN